MNISNPTSLNASAGQYGSLGALPSGIGNVEGAGVLGGDLIVVNRNFTDMAHKSIKSIINYFSLW